MDNIANSLMDMRDENIKDYIDDRLNNYVTEDTLINNYDVVINELSEEIQKMKNTEKTILTEIELVMTDNNEKINKIFSTQRDNYNLIISGIVSDVEKIKNQNNNNDIVINELSEEMQKMKNTEQTILTEIELAMTDNNMKINKIFSVQKDNYDLIINGIVSDVEKIKNQNNNNVDSTTKEQYEYIINRLSILEDNQIKLENELNRYLKNTDLSLSESIEEFEPIEPIEPIEPSNNDNKQYKKMSTKKENEQNKSMICYDKKMGKYNMLSCKKPLKKKERI